MDQVAATQGSSFKRRPDGTYTVRHVFGADFAAIVVVIFVVAVTVAVLVLAGRGAKAVFEPDDETSSATLVVPVVEGRL